MSNQVILWLTFIVPWLTLLFMKKEDVKRFMPVTIFAAITGLIVGEIGVRIGLWVFRETTFPLSMMSTFMYGIPVVATWIFRFAYGDFRLFLIADALVNFLFAFFMLPWLSSRGILIFNASLITFFIATAHGILLYGYQMWQEDALAPAMKKLFSAKLQPATKPLFRDRDEDDKK